MRTHRQATSVISLLLAAALIFGTLPVQASAASSSEIQKEIDALEAKNAELQKEIDAIQSQYDANYSDMEAMVAQKNAIDQEMTLLNSKIETTNEQISAYSQLIADTQDELDEAQEELRALSEAHRERVRVMEEEGNITYWQVIFEANSFTDLLDRVNMIEEINASDRRRIEESKYMLGNTGYSLAQISELMGFSSPSYFSQCFRKAEGLTPNEYRRQVRQGQRPAPAKRHEG